MVDMPAAWSSTIVVSPIFACLVPPSQRRSSPPSDAIASSSLVLFGAAEEEQQGEMSSPRWRRSQPRTLPTTSPFVLCRLVLHISLVIFLSVWVLASALMLFPTALFPVRDDTHCSHPTHHHHNRQYQLISVVPPPHPCRPRHSYLTTLTTTATVNTHVTSISIDSRTCRSRRGPAATRRHHDENVMVSLLAYMFLAADAQSTTTTTNTTATSYNATLENNELRVLFLFPTPLTDLGWSYQFNIARRRAVRIFIANNPNITLVDHSLLDITSLTPADFTRTLESSLVESRYHVVVALSSSVFPMLLNFSARFLNTFPATRFVDFSLPKLLTGGFKPNYAVMGLDIQAASFVIGAVAGAACTPGTGGVGMLMPTSMPSAVNAFYRGMLFGQQRHPAYNSSESLTNNGTTTMCPLVVINQNSYSDVPSEVEIANLFIQRGMRVSYFWIDHRDASLAVMRYELEQELRQDANNLSSAPLPMWSIAYAVEGTAVVGDSVVTSLLIRGGDILLQVMEDYIHNVPTNETFYVIPMRNVSDDEGMQLGAFSASAPEYVSRAGFDARTYIQTHGVLCGPIYNTSGALRVPPGVCLNISQMTFEMPYIMQGNIDMLPPWKRAAMCPPGTYVNRSLDTFALSCDVCPPGTFSATNGSAACAECPHSQFEVASSDRISCVVAVVDDDDLTTSAIVAIGVATGVSGVVLLALLIYYLIQSYRFGTFLWPAHHNFFDFSASSQAVLAVQRQLYIAGEVERTLPPQGPFVALAMIAVDNSRSDPKWRKSITFVGEVYAELGNIVNQAVYDARRHAEIVAAAAPYPGSHAAGSPSGAVPRGANHSGNSEFANLGGGGVSNSGATPSGLSPTAAAATSPGTAHDYFAASGSVNSNPQHQQAAAASGVYIAINVGDMYVLAHNDADVLLKCVAQIDKRFRRFMMQLHAQKKAAELQAQKERARTATRRRNLQTGDVDGDREFQDDPAPPNVDGGDDQPWDGEHSSVQLQQQQDPSNPTPRAKPSPQPAKRKKSVSPSADSNSTHNNSNSNIEAANGATSSSPSSSPHLMLRVLLHYGTPSIVRAGPAAPPLPSASDGIAQRRVQFLGDDIRLMKAVWSNTMAHSFSPYLVTQSAGERLTTFVAAAALRLSGMPTTATLGLGGALPETFRAADPRDKSKIIVGCYRGPLQLAKLEHRNVPANVVTAATTAASRRRSASQQQPVSPANVVAVYRLADFDPDRVGLDRNPQVVVHVPIGFNKHAHKNSNAGAGNALLQVGLMSQHLGSPNTPAAPPVSVVIEVDSLGTTAPLRLDGSGSDAAAAFGQPHRVDSGLPFDDTASQRARHAARHHRRQLPVHTANNNFDIDDTNSMHSMFSSVGSLSEAAKVAAAGGGGSDTNSSRRNVSAAASMALSSAVVKMFAESRLMMISHEELEKLQQFGGAILGRFLKGLDHEKRLDCLLFCLRRMHLEDVHQDLTMPAVTVTDSYGGYSKSVTYRGMGSSGKSARGGGASGVFQQAFLANSGLNNSAESILSIFGGSKRDATRRIARTSLEAILTQLLIMMDEIELKRWLRDVAELRTLHHDDEDGGDDRASRGSTQRSHQHSHSYHEASAEVDEAGGSTTTARERSAAGGNESDGAAGEMGGSASEALQFLVEAGEEGHQYEEAEPAAKANTMMGD